MAATQTLDISPVGRVEGDLDVRVDIEDGVVTNAWTQAEMFRGFELILKNKDPQAGLVVTPRACGICGASHLTCAAWALDTAWSTTVPRNAILARNLGQLVESIQSLPRHHYGLFMIDFTNQNYAKSAFYEEAVKRYSPFTGTSYEAGVTISGRPVEIYALLGGQWPHSSFMVPGGVMCAPTLTDVTRAWSILEHFRRNWIEPLWFGCSMERYEQIRSYDDLMVWLDERPEHANSDLGMYIRMSLDIGLDKYGKGHGKFVSWGYLPHEDKYNKPTIAGRNAAVIMKSGVYDGASDTFKLMDQINTREDTLHAWYNEGGEVHPFNRTTNPVPKNVIDTDGKYSWSTAVRHVENGRLEAGPLARQLIAGGPHGEAWQHSDPCCSTCIARWAAPRSTCGISRACTSCANSIARRSASCASSVSMMSGTSSPPKRRAGLGRDRSDPWRVVPLDRRAWRQDLQLPDHRPDHVERRAACE
ncbi:nickel-dependent hydrogenase large subunit [Hankyongella ginsenosidimutans]|uniref:nickel-dependent hydrogenase large subunit n=1 Tax=Hankyongella ginsenosidimutans TaxID=1763828 RepID=UPI001CA3737A|nr:nickel-dependent hydrogenase large subunit [Hankyongella ginsenosidimutans]